MDKDIWLSKHVTLADFCASETADRLGICNYPGFGSEQDIGEADVVFARMRALCTHVLDPVADYFGMPLMVTSGYRCPALNKAVGGVLASQHAKGEAADLVVGGVPALTVARFIFHHLDFDQLILEKHDPDRGAWGWLHCSYVGEKDNRGQVISFDGQAYYDGLRSGLA